jgi:hypothetical protein
MLYGDEFLSDTKDCFGGSWVSTTILRNWHPFSLLQELCISKTSDMNQLELYLLRVLLTLGVEVAQSV